ncbi:MAG: BON domain-containing protein, partial [Dehalococcoidia bacterium]
NNAEVLGGFGPTSMTDMTVDPSAEGARLGDEALTAAILRELREDALTTDLRIHVTVREGVAYLRGTVEGIEDADAAEEVAARVPGITEVVEELRVVEI